VTIEHAFGIDIGGSGMKAAPVKVATGELTAERHKILTPQPATPAAMAPIVAELVEHFGWSGPIGVTFPGVVRHGVIHSAANVDKAWIDTDADALFTAACGADVNVVNDADAAGLAEVRFGAGKDVRGVVIVLTFGTGIGSGMFVDGVLVPNTELGHLEIDGKDAERRAAASARDREGLSWKDWAKRLQRYYTLLETLLQPDLVIVGGGVSKKHDKFLPLLELRSTIVPAELRNEAGIIGAAVMAAESEGT
jgi:polyphosphate glucokinase